jgi:hypothetical protein
MVLMSDCKAPLGPARAGTDGVWGAIPDLKHY